MNESIRIGVTIYEVIKPHPFLEYFFHQSACTGASFQDLREGQAVTFDAGQGPKGPRGENVRLA